MRKVTATEKYRAVNEGQLSKANFLKDMQIAYPQVISQLNGYDTSVQILKNRGFIHEKSSIDSYDSRTDLNISPDSIDRGIRYEMQARGKEASDCKDIVMKNLKKDPLHYIMLVAKDSSKVNKHDKEVEVKRGANDVDTFNGLKKADLKENKKELSKLLKEGKMSDLAEKLGVDVSRLQDAADRLREMEREEAANSANKVEAMKAVIEEEPDEVMNIDRFGKEKEDHDSNYTKVKEEEVVSEVKVGDILSKDGKKGKVIKISDTTLNDITVRWATIDFGNGDFEGIALSRIKGSEIEEAKGHMVDEHEYEFFSIIFDKKYDDILEDYMSSDSFKQDEKELQAEKGQANVFDYAYKDQWENFIKEFEAVNRDDVSEEEVSEDIEAFSDTIEVVGYPETVEDALKVIERYERDRDPVSREEAKEIIADMRATDDDDFDRNITNLIVKAFAIKLKGVSEEEVEEIDTSAAKASLDAFAAREKELDRQNPNRHKEAGAKAAAARDAARAARKKSRNNTARFTSFYNKEEKLREAVKNIIVRTLNEDTVNEAATNQLAKYAEEYSSFQGMKETIIALENIVTEIESFYDKTKGKIQKIYDSIGEVRNEEGLKVGAFIAPSIENAFNRDLRPIVKAGFTKGLDVPKIKTISQAEVDALKNETPVYEEEPKRSVFSPVYENKNKNKKSKK